MAELKKRLESKKKLLEEQEKNRPKEEVPKPPPRPQSQQKVIQPKPVLPKSYVPGPSFMP